MWGCVCVLVEPAVDVVSQSTSIQVRECVSVWSFGHTRIRTSEGINNTDVRNIYVYKYISFWCARGVGPSSWEG